MDGNTELCCLYQSEIGIFCKRFVEQNSVFPVLLDAKEALLSILVDEQLNYAAFPFPKDLILANWISSQKKEMLQNRTFL